MPIEDLHAAANRAWWDERAALHPDTAMYRRWIEKLRAGGHPLQAVELAEVGDVRGRRLLHLQCHIGTDTMGWARLGAEVTGVDFSPAALEQARRLAEELGLPARWIECDVLQLEGRLDEQFEVVFSSYGAISWLRDLTTWARTIHGLLAPGGCFVLVDGHPTLYTLDQENGEEGPRPVVRYPYFAQAEPQRFADGGSYADASLETQANEVFEWPHGLGEVVTALLDAGLRLESLREHRECPWPALPMCVEDAQGVFRLPPPWDERVPLLFSLRARRPA